MPQGAGCKSSVRYWCPQDVAEDYDDEKYAATDGYVFNSPADMQDIRMQRQAIWGLLKSLGSHILREGVNLTRITLPIRVFEPRSFLQRLTDNWAYVHLLGQAADAPDPAERMRYLVHNLHNCVGVNSQLCCFCIKALHLGSSGGCNSLKDDMCT
jgi:hypothetical protein